MQEQTMLFLKGNDNLWKRVKYVCVNFCYLQWFSSDMKIKMVVFKRMNISLS